MDGFFLLIIAALLWVGVHVGIAGSATRAAMIARIGEIPFRILYSVLSFGAIGLLVNAWGGAETAALWFAPGWLRMVLALLMWPAFVFFVASVTTPNPTAVGGERLLETEPRGITRITRHPMLWSFAVWAAVHMLGNGDTASLLFFGAFLVTALMGMPSIDAKLAARAPAAWPALAAKTSILPFGAILAGRNRLVLREIGWLPPLIGTLGWLAILHLHPRLFGVPALLW
jgi:uncharacterized membrane protein